ncbi:hypothetical protein F5Y03DRAFT_393682 [Xylaria venustula]|nr:hypothetical protein F5Y03DRAFT_393682 [Xylaria venustula]
MSASARVPHRRRACFACADVKRACDRKLPECQRCLDRDVDCVYPTSKRHQPVLPRAGQVDNLLLGNILDSELVMENWGALGTSGSNISVPELIFPSLPMSRTEEPGGGLFEVDTPYPWFLESDTWTIEHKDPEPSGESANPDEFIERIMGMLRSWVETGHSGFIHRRLYRNGLPRCLQDAYTVLSSYINSTAIMKTMTLEIAHERSTALAAEEVVPLDDRAETILAHLARTQAMFIYQCIELFDGSIRHRALAERQISILQLWTMQMWDVITKSRDEQNPYRKTLQRLQSETDTSRKLSVEMWQSWILAESARRTFVVVSFTTSVFLTLRDGWADCCGGVMLTARRGLWDEQSATKWFEMCCDKPPLLVSSLRPERYLPDLPAAEVDGFVTTIWTLLVGSEAVRNWVA